MFVTSISFQVTKQQISFFLPLQIFSVNQSCKSNMLTNGGNYTTFRKGGVPYLRVSVTRAHSVVATCKVSQHVKITANQEKVVPARRDIFKQILLSTIGLRGVVSAEAAVAQDDVQPASSRMSYSRFLEYLDMGRVKKVDLYENNTAGDPPGMLGARVCCIERT
eukprot:TRINITY_DN2107_c0_g1_i3.p2 TRINITY_DN2107_c0_g1~~TRINITY_DN2107_c0_g1_i3.p2  ORF type:complete len:164 (-),score=2.79 TRINITY_DN2107_c0_g1_i3:38-529(-)